MDHQSDVKSRHKPAVAEAPRHFEFLSDDDISQVCAWRRGPRLDVLRESHPKKA